MKKCQSTINECCVSLRFVTFDDAAFLMELNNDLEIAKYVVGNPKQVTLQEQMLWMKNLRLETGTKRFIVEHEGKSVGTVIISNINTSNLTANVNIKLHKNARGKGIGKQSIKQALRYCFEDIGMFCVTANVLSYNMASLRLFRSLGFTEEGILRSRVIKNDKRCDLISFSILREDFEL